MSSVNKAIILGNLGADPELRYTRNQDPVCEISVATSETWKDREGNKQERTEWHRIVFWRRLAEVVADFLRKGDKIYVEGVIQTEKWTDDQGVDRYTTKIKAREMRMLGSRSDNQDAGDRRNPQQRRDREFTNQEPPPVDDDLPF